MSTRMRTTFSMKVLLTGTLLAVATLGSYGCGPVVPVTPTWEHDVRPLMLARCIRCHDDPAPEAVMGILPFSFNYATFADIPTTPVRLVDLWKMQLGNAIRGKLFRRRMPPPPTAALEDWQIETLDSWIANPQ
jgi:hypothetical protein